MRTLLAPFDQTAYLCGMGWLEPFVIHSGRKLEPQALSSRTNDTETCSSGSATIVSIRTNILAEGYPLPPGFRSRAAHVDAS